MNASKNGVWSCDADSNKKLNKLYLKATEQGKTIFLIFKLFASRCYLGAAKMCSEVDFENRSGCWQIDRSIKELRDRKWCGEFHVRWLFLKDISDDQMEDFVGSSVPLTSIRHCQEIPYYLGFEILKAFDSIKAKSTLVEAYRSR